MITMKIIKDIILFRTISFTHSIASQVKLLTICVPCTSYTTKIIYTGFVLSLLSLSLQGLRVLMFPFYHTFPKWYHK